jgi:hypothetical protein
MRRKEWRREGREEENSIGSKEREGKMERKGKQRD